NPKVLALAHRIEVRDGRESALCARVIHDARIVHGRAVAAGARATAASDALLAFSTLTSQQELATMDLLKLQTKEASLSRQDPSLSQYVDMLSSFNATMGSTLDAILSNTV